MKGIRSIIELGYQLNYVISFDENYLMYFFSAKIIVNVQGKFKATTNQRFIPDGMVRDVSLKAKGKTHYIHTYAYQSCPESYNLCKLYLVYHGM